MMRTQRLAWVVALGLLLIGTAGCFTVRHERLPNGVHRFDVRVGVAPIDDASRP